MPLFNPRQLLRPSSVDEAVEILKRDKGSARLVAGDVTLYDLAQHGGLDDVSTLVDTSRLGLSFVEDRGDELAIGATTTFSELEAMRFAPARGIDALFETAAKITPPQVRNMGTIGGSLCSGIPFFDMPTAVLALGGAIHAKSPRGERTIACDDFFVGYFQTIIEFDEIVISVNFRYSERGGSSFVKLGRVAVDFAVVNVATWMSLDQKGKCVNNRIALGAIANTPVRWKSLEEELVGKELTRDYIIKITKELELDIEPLPTIGAPSDYKKLVAPKLVRDSLLESLNRVPGKAHSA
jgi:aerobic carbon-monoxide dehydrogenase medium subunit